MLLWNRAIVRGGSARISRLLYLEPVVSVLGAMVFLGERATAAVLAGGRARDRRGAHDGGLDGPAAKAGRHSGLSPAAVSR